MYFNSVKVVYLIGFFFTIIIALTIVVIFLTSTDVKNIFQKQFNVYDRYDYNLIIENTRDSQEQLTTLSYKLQDIAEDYLTYRYDIVNVLNKYYDEATENWFTKEIGIPRSFMIAT